jgi:hypothetical protein
MHMLEMIWPHIHLISGNKGSRDGESDFPATVEEAGGSNLSTTASDYGGSNGWGGGSVGSGDGGSDSQYSDDEAMV